MDGYDFCGFVWSSGAAESAGDSVGVVLYCLWNWIDIAEKFGWSASGGAERVFDADLSSAGFVQRGISAFVRDDTGIDDVCAGAAGIFCVAARSAYGNRLF